MNLYNAARKLNQPLVVYMRDTFDLGIGLTSDFVGEKELIDFNLYKSYQQLTSIQDQMKSHLEYNKFMNLTSEHEGYWSSVNKDIVYTYGDF